MRMCFGLRSTINPTVRVKGINFISLHRTRNCQQARDESVPRIPLLNQLFEVARPIKKKNVIIKQRRRQSRKWLKQRKTTHLLRCRAVNGTQGSQIAGWYVSLEWERLIPEQKLLSIQERIIQTLNHKTPKWALVFLRCRTICWNHWN